MQQFFKKVDRSRLIMAKDLQDILFSREAGSNRYRQYDTFVLNRRQNNTIITSACWCKSVYSFFFFLVFLGPHSWHTEAPKLGVKLELQLLAYATATAMPDPSHVWDLHHSTPQCQILNPLKGQGQNPRPHGYQSGSLTTEPRQELQECVFFKIQKEVGKMNCKLKNNNNDSFQGSENSGLIVSFL